jgi:hypothetical protein
MSAHSPQPASAGLFAIRQFDCNQAAVRCNGVEEQLSLVLLLCFVIVVLGYFAEPQAHYSFER